MDLPSSSGSQKQYERREEEYEKNGTNKNDYFTYNYDEKYILIK